MATKRVVKKKKTGRPSPYEPRFNRMAYRHSLLGATDVELAQLFEVSVKTLNTWKGRYPEFLQSLKDGKAEADTSVTHSLYHRARGYSHPAVKIFCSKDGDVTQVPYRERYPPDTTAAIFWLKNRQPKLWRDKTEVNHDFTPEAIAAMTDKDQLRKIAEGR